MFPVDLFEVKCICCEVNIFHGIQLKMVKVNKWTQKLQESTENNQKAMNNFEKLSEQNRRKNKNCSCLWFEQINCLRLATNTAN